MTPFPHGVRRARIACLALVFLAASCTTASDPVLADFVTPNDGATTSSTIGGPPTTTSGAVPVPSTTTEAPILPEPGSVVVRTPTGILALWHATNADGTMEVSTPCDRIATVPPSELVHGIDVLLDPGHGGLDPGAVDKANRTEADLNLDVSRQVAELLRASGYTVEMTRDDDYFRTIADRATMALGAAPRAFVSVHHNSGVDDPYPTGIGTEIYYQKDTDESRRLGGLIYEQLDRRLGEMSMDWTRSSRFGVRYRDNGTGSDFYGVLRRTVGVPSVLIEAAYMSNRAEADMLATAGFRTAEAQAIADGLVAYLESGRDGAGYEDGIVDPGSGGGGTDLTACIDPDLD